MITDTPNPPDPGILHSMGYIGKSSSRGCGFSALSVINRASILATLVSNRACFLRSSLFLGTVFLEEATFSSLSI